MVFPVICGRWTGYIDLIMVGRFPRICTFDIIMVWRFADRRKFIAGTVNHETSTKMREADLPRSRMYPILSKSFLSMLILHSDNRVQAIGIYVRTGVSEVRQK